MQLHHELMTNACELHLAHFLRFKQYYRHMEIAPEELAAVSGTSTRCWQHPAAPHPAHSYNNSIS